MLLDYYSGVVHIFKRWGLEHWGLAFRGEGLHPLSLLLSVIPGFEGRVLVCYMEHHKVWTSIHLKASVPTSHGLELLKSSVNQAFSHPKLIISGICHGNRKLATTEQAFTGDHEQQRERKHQADRATLLDIQRICICRKQCFA